MCGIVWLRLKVVQSRSPIQVRIGENPGQSEALYTSLVYGNFAPAMNWQEVRIVENPGQSEALYTSLVYGDFAPTNNW